MKTEKIFTLLPLFLLSLGANAQNLTPIQSQILGKPTFSVSNNRNTGETQIQVMPTPGVVLSTTGGGSNAPIQNAPGNVTALPNNLDEEGPPPSQAAIRGMNRSAATPVPMPSTKDLNPMTSRASPVTPINPVGQVNMAPSQTESKPIGQQKPNMSHVYVDISSWNKTTIEQHEKEGKKMAEDEYRKFLMK